MQTTETQNTPSNTDLYKEDKEFGFKKMHNI